MKTEKQPAEMELNSQRRLQDEYLRICRPAPE